ncbi:hypothetical protein QFZ84_000455 [Pseudomonas fluorescens]
MQLSRPDQCVAIEQIAHQLLEEIQRGDYEPITLGRSHLPAELACVAWAEIEHQLIYSILESIIRSLHSAYDLLPCLVPTL